MSEVFVTPAFKRKLKNKIQSGKNKRQKSRLPSIMQLCELKRLAFRRRIWFRALSHIERSVLDLTMRYVDNIKSAKLAKIVTAILNKLKSTLESFVDNKVRTIGRSLAQKMSAIAVSWGHQSARDWSWDRSYARYLAICCEFRAGR